MSKFFRSSNSISSSDSSSTSSADNDETEHVAPTTEESSLVAGHELESEQQDVAVLNRPSPPGTNQHREFLLHALLEERCMNEVLSERERATRLSSQENVQAEANRRYQRLCDRLASYNLISAGLEHENHAKTRQRYRDGLNVISRQPDGGSGRSTVPYTLRRLLTGPENVQYSTGQLEFAPTIGNRQILESRYRQEFEELSTLGRGGYGVVYHVRHRLDNQAYAVKKVPLSPARLQRIQRRGQSELEEVLREVRTLARLDHPNIVRYFAGWIEWIDSLGPSRLVEHTASSQDHQVVTGAEDDTRADVLFEDSSAISSRGLSEPPASAPDGHDDNFALRRVGTKGTTATVSDADDTIETVDRTEPSFSMQSTSSVIKFSEPTLALHMQMSLHPMTLADFISPPEDVAGKAPSLRHCFHIGPSLSIIAAILDGIEYLHSEGIVHRDIKPANIFLGPHNNPRATNGSVDLMLCNDCRQEHAVNPIRLEIRIGDFGLVSVADPANEPSNVSAHVQPSNVGTEIYRPVTQEATLVPSALDIYALGIVLFELLCPFSTRMERLHIINKLKEGCYPDKFCNGSEGPAGIERCISAMLGSEGSDTTVAGIRAMIAALQK